MRECMEKDWNMMEKRLVMSVCLLAGLLLGFMIAPVKRGIYCGNNNGNTQLADEKKNV